MNLTAQQWVVIVVVGAAAAYLLIKVCRLLAGKPQGCGPHGCDSCPAVERPDAPRSDSLIPPEQLLEPLNREKRERG